MDRADSRNGPAVVAANPPDGLPLVHRLPPLPPKWSAPTADAPPEGIWRNFENVHVRCTMSACGDGLHCYKLTKNLARSLGLGTCRVCQKALVSLERTSERNLHDVDHTFAALQTEAIRHFFWHIPFGEKALAYAKRAGRRTLYRRVPGRIRSRIGAASPYKDGMQTPTSPEKADALDYAMHAIAACCRTCASYWHGIEKDRPLTEEEVEYLAAMAWSYLEARLPNLSDEGSRVPRSASRREEPQPDRGSTADEGQPERPARAS